jgi:SAM-dependent methyltransferase
MNKSRNTDQDWTLIGESQPFFGVLTEPKYLSENLNQAAIDEFYSSGTKDIDYILQRSRETVGVPKQLRDILDFGSGVGRLTFALASHGATVVGVDVSGGMRTRAQQEAKNRRIANVSFRADIPDRKFDWINSLIVFQHISPSEGIPIFSKLVKCLRPGGLLTIQITYAHDYRHLGEILAEMQEYVFDGNAARILWTEKEPTAGEMRMFDYDLNAIFRILHRNRLSKVYTEHTDHSGCHGMRLFAVLE